MVYPHKWSPISCKSSAGQGKFAGQRPMFYHCATQPGEEHAHTPTDLTAIFHVTWISRLLFFMTWNPTTSHWLKHLIWLRTAHSGSCWQCLVLCTLVLQDN